MKIGSIFTQTNAVLRYSNNAVKPKAPDRKASSFADGDKVEFSSYAQIQQTLIKSASGAAEIRADAVSRIKEQIESGDYYIPANLVAQKMLQTAVV